MKMLMIVVDSGKKEELEVVLRNAGVPGWTEIADASGMGTTGPRLGSAAFPKTSAVIFTLLPPDRVGPLAADLRSYCADCGERLKMVAWDVAEVL
ncbi:hypothetical protein FBQ97_19860 [Acidobacteria bacterium ACD]|nr:MAG: hypothetical protein EDX89_15630 [Acidobacteriota bacterium]MCE7957251.1 hypothetical protein [Acidobacteria bacterium ACB2]MDL1952043.1 hypothetical protein [Acidobacteria bacterium ACD]